MRNVAAALALAAVSIFGLAGPAIAQEQFEHPRFPPPPHERQAPDGEKKLKNFDALDFDVFKCPRQTALRFHRRASASPSAW